MNIAIKSILKTFKQGSYSNKSGINNTFQMKMYLITLSSGRECACLASSVCVASWWWLLVSICCCRTATRDWTDATSSLLTFTPGSANQTNIKDTSITQLHAAWWRYEPIHKGGLFILKNIKGKDLKANKNKYRFFVAFLSLQGFFHAVSSERHISNYLKSLMTWFFHVCHN